MVFLPRLPTNQDRKRVLRPDWLGGEVGKVARDLDGVSAGYLFAAPPKKMEHQLPLTVRSVIHLVRLFDRTVYISLITCCLFNKIM